MTIPKCPRTRPTRIALLRKRSLTTKMIQRDPYRKITNTFDFVDEKKKQKKNERKNRKEINLNNLHNLYSQPFSGYKWVGFRWIEGKLEGGIRGSLPLSFFLFFLSYLIIGPSGIST